MCTKEDADSSTDGRSSSQQVTRTRDYLANRRTLLAWVRTGVSLIGFGLVIERFAAETNPTGVSVVFGVALAVLGCIALVVGMVDFIRTRRDIAEENLTTAASVGGYMVVAGASLVLAGAFIAYVVHRLI
jgi:inner membrane protein YidH